ESLECLDFINDRENLIFMGAVGTGKSHLASALALKACQNGHQVRFYTAARLANILYEKNKKGQFESFIKSLQKLGLLVIDEIGFVPLHMEAAELLYQVIADCYERRSVIVTTNLEFSHWNTVFIGKKVTAAIIDRLVHHSHILIFSGESYRLAQSMKRAGKKVTE
ncbi:IS21-like element helper ATPase IstB, partial [Acetobacterium bakii]